MDGWMNGTTSEPKSLRCCKLDKVSNFFSGILCFLDNFQDLPNKSLANELNKCPKLEIGPLYLYYSNDLDSFFTIIFIAA